jgi:hypothetical protein
MRAARCAAAGCGGRTFLVNNGTALEYPELKPVTARDDLAYRLPGFGYCRQGRITHTLKNLETPLVHCTKLVHTFAVTEYNRK